MSQENQEPGSMLESTMLLGDNIYLMEDIADGTIDLIVTDPPYNAKKGFPNDDMPEDQFLAFTRKWFSIAARKLKDTGSFYCFINDEYYCKFRAIFSESLIYHRTIVWNFEGFFNNPGKNYDNRHEYVLFYTKSSEYTFNVLKEPPSESYLERWAPYADADGNIPWDSLSPTERVRYNRENYEKNPKNIKRGLYQGTTIRIPRDDVLIRGNLVYLPFPLELFSMEGDSVFMPRPRYKEHPTQKPERLIATFIQVSSNHGDIVMDPFAGIGTTVIVAKKLGRTGIGMEIDDGYFKEGVSILEKAFEGEKLKNTLWKRDDKRGRKRLDEFL